MSSSHACPWLEREDFDQITVVRIKPPRMLDEDTIRDIFDPIYGLTAMGLNRLVLNLAAAEQLPSLALGKLVMLNRKTQAADGRLTLSCLSDTVAEVLRVTHLERVFVIYATEQEALQSFAEEHPTPPGERGE